MVGVKVKAPVEGLNAMLEVSPVADSIIEPPLPDGSVAVTMKRRFPPTVAFKAPGTVRIGSMFDETTVIVRDIARLREPLVPVTTIG